MIKVACPLRKNSVTCRSLSIAGIGKRSRLVRVDKPNWPELSIWGVKIGINGP